MTIEYTIEKYPWESKQYIVNVWSRSDSYPSDIPCLAEYTEVFHTLFFARRFAKRSVRQVELRLQGPIMIDDARLPSTTILEDLSENSQ